jgi:hypothetical protein
MFLIAKKQRVDSREHRAERTEKETKIQKAENRK